MSVCYGKAREAAAIAAETAAQKAAAIEREVTEIERELCTVALAAVGRTPEDIDPTREAVVVVVGGHAFRIEGGRNDHPWYCDEVVPEDFIVLD